MMMKTHSLFLAAAILVMGSSLASAQTQYDSLGSPTPRPNQNAAPATMPNIPNPNRPGQDATTAMSPKADAKSPATSEQGLSVSAGTAGTEKTNGVTPGGLTPD
jgi:hypothetical protein